MGAWAGPFLIAAVLLAAAGIAKLVDPANTVGALRGFGIGVPPAAVRLAGALEAALAVVAGSTGAALPRAARRGVVCRVLRLRRRRARHPPPDRLLRVLREGRHPTERAPPRGEPRRRGRRPWGSRPQAAAGSDPCSRRQPLAAVPFLLLVAIGAYAALTRARPSSPAGRRAARGPGPEQT